MEKYDEVYERINDPEYAIIMELKNTDKNEYLNAIHTAYLSDKVATGLGRDRRICKCLGYYHRVSISKLSSFPPDALSMLKLYKQSATNPPVAGEIVICTLAADIISSMRILLQRKPDEKLDHEKIIEYVFEKRRAKGFFSNCDMTMNELRKMKDCFKEEKLYYDFLR